MQRHLRMHQSAAIHDDSPGYPTHSTFDQSAGIARGSRGYSTPSSVGLPLPAKKHGETLTVESLSCNVCAKTFASQKTLKKHQETVHRQSVSFSCWVCDRHFYRRDQLKRHHIGKHADQEYETPSSYRCPVCQKSFHYHGHLREHLKTHPGVISSPPTCPASPWVPPASGLCTDARMCPAKLPASVPEDCRQCYRENWSQIRSHQRGGKCVLVHTQRLEVGSDIGGMLQAIFHAQRNAFKVNLVFGFILSNVETREKQYYYPLQNGLIFNQPLVVADEADLERMLQHVGETDWFECIRQQKPNSKCRTALLANVAFRLCYSAIQNSSISCQSHDQNVLQET